MRPGSAKPDRVASVSERPRSIRHGLIGFGLGDGPLGLGDVEVLDHAAADGDHALAGRRRPPRRRPTTSRARSSSSALGANTRLAGSSWLGWISVLPSKPSSTALQALGLEALGVLDVVVDAVEDHLARGPGGQQAEAEPGEQGLAAGHVLRLELLGQVVRAHHEHREPLGRRRDAVGVEHRDRRLEHRPDRRVVRRAAGLERLLDRAGGRRPS